MRRYYARRETRRSSMAIPLNGMPRANKPNGLRMPPADGRKRSPEELRQTTPFLPPRTTAITTNRLANAPNQNANPRSAATPANRSIRNAILPTHTEWTTTAVGSPFATPTNFAAVFTTKA